MTLLDWNNELPIDYLWIVGFGCPAGMEFRHDTDTEDEEAYCDFGDLDLLSRLWDLEGTVDENGTWCWNGEGEVTDERGNTIYNVKARRTPTGKHDVRNDERLEYGHPSPLNRIRDNAEFRGVAK